METTLMTIDISVTDIEDNNNMEEESGAQQLMVDMECPNCKVFNTFSKYIYDKGYFIIFVARVVGCWFLSHLTHLHYYIYLDCKHSTVYKRVGILFHSPNNMYQIFSQSQ